MVNHIDNISTDKQPISDHCMVSFNLHSSEQIEAAKFLFTQDWSQATKNLEDYGAEYEPELTEMWHEHNIHAMWEKLITGINNVCINLVPSKIIQCRADFIPYKNQKIIDQEEKTRLCFQNAITTNNDQDWEELKESKQTLRHLWEKAIKVFYPKELLNPHKVWHFLKTVTGGSKISIPSTIIENGMVTQAPTKIASIMNLFWNVKIQKIRIGFKAIYFNPLIFLHNLIPAPKRVFKIPHITIGDVVSIIKKSKNSSSRGFNETSMKFLKISPAAFAPHITFPINRSLMAGVFPSILKISRILPILKPGKNRLEKTSYRPISNLHCVEKIFEEHIKKLL